MYLHLIGITSVIYENKGKKMKLQLKDFQEDMTLKLDCIMVLLAYGLNFNAWICGLITFATIMQFFYTMRYCSKYEKQKKEVENEKRN